MAGRPRKPQGLKILQGTNRKDRERSTAVKVHPASPRPPKWLEGEALAEYRRIIREFKSAGILTPLDRGALVTYVVLWGRFVEASQTGTEIKASWLAEMRRLGDSLGLSPASREKLPAKAASPGQNSAWADFESSAAKAGGR